MDIEILRNTYHDLAMEADELINELTVKDPMGRVVESGYAIINSVQRKVKANEDVLDALDIVGQERWIRLSEIWVQMGELSRKDRKLSKDLS